MKPHNDPIETVIELARREKDVVVITTDVAESTQAARFARERPGQFIQCGRSDTHAILLAIGLADTGKRPIVITYAVNTIRSLDALMLAAQNDSNITIIATHAGLSSGQEGAGTQTLHDIAAWRSIPNLTILAPADVQDAHKAIIAACTQRGPAIVRLPRQFTQAITSEKTPFHVAKATPLRKGADCIIISCGTMLSLALQAADRLARADIECTVLHNHTLKPLDKNGILSSCLHAGCAVTIEEHSTLGGLGSAVAELLAGENVPLEIIGAPDAFGESGTPSELFGRFGFTVEHLVTAVKTAIVRKCRTPCTDLHEQHAQYLIPPAPDLHFRLQSGGIIKTIPELASALSSMDDLTYAHHAAHGDFTRWVTDVFKAKELAAMISRKKNKLAMASTIARWLR